MLAPVFCNFCGAANQPQDSYCHACARPINQSQASITTHGTGRLPAQYLLNQQYLVIETLGQGGFGAVYKAVDTHLNRPVAIKEMGQSNLSAQEQLEALDNFKREARMLAALQHPGLPRIYEEFSEGGRSYLVMDFIDGETLEKRWMSAPNHQLPADEVVQIGLDLCSILDYLHSRQPPIIFRDLKPANILLTKDQHVFLIDFGIARHFKPGQRNDTQALGSPGYAPPEQHGKQAHTTPASDVYSLGATLHQLLSGNDPANTPFQFQPLGFSHNTPLQELEMLILRMVEVAATNRPDSITYVQQQLQDIKDEMQGSAILPAPDTQGTLICAYTEHTDSIGSVAWEPSGLRVASAGDDATIQLWNARDGSPSFQYKQHPSVLRSIAWSPDAGKIASAGMDHIVQVWDASNGDHLLSYQNHGLWVRTLAWSPDGKFIASGGDDGTVHIWNAMTGKTQRVYRRHLDSVCALAWSPDGKSLVSGSDDETVHIWDAATGQMSGIYQEHTNYVRAVAWSPDGLYIASASWDDTVHVGDSRQTSLPVIYDNHTDRVNAVCWSPLQNDYLLASASSDTTVHIWNGLTGDTVYVYRGHQGGVNAVAWSPDGKSLASGGDDATVHVWLAQ
jgi:serine/threonine protein kinase